MKVILSPRAEKQLRKISKVNQIIISNKIRSLKKPHITTNQKQLRGYKNIFRIRIGDYRIIYRKTSKEIYIVLIGHRKDVYNILEKFVK